MSNEETFRLLLEDVKITRLGPNATWGQIEDAFADAAAEAAELALVSNVTITDAATADEWERREAAARVAA